MLPTYTALFAAGILALLPQSHPAATQVQVLQDEGFEDNTFTAGQPLDGQGEWFTIAGRDAVLVTDEVAHRGHKGVVILGSAVVPTERNMLEAFAGRYILFDPVREGLPVVHLRASARLDGPDTGDGIKDALACANWYSATVAGENLGAIHVCSDGGIYYSAGGGPYDNYAIPYAIGTFVDLDIVLDFTTQTTRFVIDGQSIGSMPLHSEPLTTTEIVAAPFELNMSRGHIKSDERRLFRAYFDDYSILVGTN
jgi:hypothetical protein